MLDESQKRTLFVGILLVPGTVLVFVPVLILWLFADDPGALDLASTDHYRFYVGILIGVIGLAVSIWSMRLFSTIGNGTPVPWKPPSNFVVEGPFRHVRNPMVMGILFALLGECVLFGSWYLFCWLIFVKAFNLVYIRFVEEAELENRFGSPYINYKKNVRGWIPRLRPWDMPSS